MAKLEDWVGVGEGEGGAGEEERGGGGRDIGAIRLGLLILNEYGCRIVDILTRNVYNSG